MNPEAASGRPDPIRILHLRCGHDQPCFCSVAPDLFQPHFCFFDNSMSSVVTVSEP
jgi:hypothetical protein